MRIYVTSIFVNDQLEALKFYTETLGFVKKEQVPIGENYWLTVTSPEGADGVELLLEPSEHPAVGPYRAALVKDGIPAKSFAVDDCRAEFERLRKLGVEFTQPPVDMDNLTMAVFDDTCGNLIQILERR